ncbi:permease [Leptolyngbya sp. Heron Island J]|uniref:sodium-dependent bicarbonate transport family permease n=1 Tax=Leptolyngbya sp. Heron Island J TaxID=1385935 RepID=UPI0003B96D7D|nr:sodium-dependent bicarbonate transport family permease [Leptolyngbya sp. Heron Island J]ESA34255.1 permease [Leptolyngbya sp. Heron Island J]
MDSSLILSNVLNPPVLFFFLGLTAVLLKSDLEVPQPIPKLFSLYLLLAIGFKGSHEFHASGLSGDMALALIAAVVVAAVVPVYSFFILRLKLDLYNAAAIAVTYGSISAVTFVTASSFLSRVNVDFDSHRVAALALMESPAIIVGLLLVRVFANHRDARSSQDTFDWSEVLRESCLNGLTFVLLDMGLVAARRFKDLLTVRWRWL